MLSDADNQRLTRVGPGTPMGGLLRRYWHPIAALSELERRGVMKTRILGEDLVLFRDTAGGLGLVGDRCAHRGAGLAWGIVDPGGLRCAYHGWLYDRSGRAVDMPLEGPSCPLRGKVGVTAYPVEALGGLVFAYLGPEPRPELPRWDLLVWPNAIRQIGSYVLPCNWLNAVENGLDPAHNHYLHGYFVRDRLVPDGAVDTEACEAMRIDHNIYYRYVDVEYEDRSYGLLQTFRIASTDVLRGSQGARRRIFNNLIFPCSTRKAGTIRTELQIRTPIDDTHTLYFAYQAYIPPNGHEIEEQASVPGYQIPIADDDGRPALDHVMGQDAAIWCSQGEIADRTREHLVRSDAGILLYRKLLFAQLDAIAAGVEPIRATSGADGVVDFEPPCLPDGKIDETKLGYDSVYHDRFGPMIGAAMDLVQRARASVVAGGPKRDR